MHSLFRNISYSLRMLRRNPGLTSAVVATLALGIGATTAIYTVIYATLLSPLPLPHPEQLVMVWSKIQGNRNGIAAGDFLDWQRYSTSFQELCAFTGGNFNLGTKDKPEQVEGRLASPGFFRMMGLPLMLGRDFLSQEGIPGNDKVVILTHKLWNKLGADDHIVGRQLRINGGLYTVVGVLAPGVADRYDAQLTAPLAFRPEQINHDYHWLLATARLKAGVTIKQAQADMNRVTARVAEENPRSDKGWGALVEPLQNDFMPKDRIQTLWLLLGAVGFVLLIACVNVANLLLAKSTFRWREVAVRNSVGASRRQVFEQFVIESVVLAGAGGVAGVLLGIVLLRCIVALMPPGTLPSEVSLHLNIPILSVTAAATILVGILSGSAPAWYASKLDPASSLKQGGRAGEAKGHHMLRRVLVVGELALALTLLSAAGLALHSFWNLTQIDLGVRTDHVLMFSLQQPDGRFRVASGIEPYYKQVLEHIQALPAVSSAAVVTGAPLLGTSDGIPFTIVGTTVADPSQRPGAGFQSISPEYFRTFGIRLVKGRQFSDADTATSPRVAMVNEEFVKEYLKNRDPLNTRLSIEQIDPTVQKLGAAVEWRIEGVFHNVRSFGLRADQPEIDVPFPQSPLPSVTVGLRSATNPVDLSAAVVKAIYSIDPDVAVSHLSTMNEVRDRLFIGDRFTMMLYVGFAFVALTLAAIGVYGVISFGVSRRTQEIGLRMALGAEKGAVERLIISESSVLTLIGLALGVLGAALLGRLMHTTLYGVQAFDSSVLLAVSIVLFGTALLAAYIPARRAAAIDPMTALRRE